MFDDVDMGVDILILQRMFRSPPIVASDSEIYVYVDFQQGSGMGILILHAHGMVVIEAVVLVETAVPVP